MKWFDRKFNFDHLDGSFPGILERLKGTPIRLLTLVASIPQEMYNKSLDGSWSIQEQVGHLGDLESLWNARFVDFIKGKEVLTEADLTNRKTHEAGHNDQRMDDLLKSFNDQRANLCGFLATIKAKSEQWHSKHPRLLIPMRPIDLAYFIAEHDDHHLARINELYRQLNQANNE